MAYHVAVASGVAMQKNEEKSAFVMVLHGLALLSVLLFAVPSYAFQGIVPVNPQTGAAASTFTPSLSSQQFSQASGVLTEFTTANPNFTMFDVSNVLQQQGLNPTQMLELGAQSSMSAQQLGELGNVMKLQGTDTGDITAGMQHLSKMPDVSGAQGANMQKAVGAMGEMTKLGTISHAEFGQFSEGVILDASSLQDITGGAGNLTASSQQAVQAVTGQIEQMGQAGAAEALGSMSQLGSNLMNNVTPALPGNLLGGVSDLIGGLDNFLGGLQLPGFSGGFGSFGGGGGAGSPSNYDHAQRSKQVTRATGARGAGAGGTPMPMKGTSKVNMENLTPYLWKSLMGCGEDDPRKFYDGPASTFGRNNQYYNNKMAGYDDPDEIRQVSSTTTTSATGPHARLKGCTTRLEPEGGIPNGNYNELSAEFLQKQAQHCASEYLALNSPYIAENNNPRVHSVDAAKDCQPLKMMPPQEEEFDLGKYYASCWKKTLNDPNHTMRSGLSGAAGEPGYGSGVVIKNANHASVQAPGSFPSMNGALLARNPQEEITYPCHPFGMRWDYSVNDRDDYSPLTKEYNGDSTAVRCSGTQSREIKVDILEPRKNVFDKRVLQRIEFNKACKANKIKACCLRVPVGLFATECIPQPCWKCFGASADSPPCATRYDGKDKSVLPIYEPKGIYFTRLNPQPWCGAVHAERMCKDVAKSVVMMNKLKLRHYSDVTGDPNAGDEDDEERLFNTGMKFPDYFENRRPYMRFWDLGTAYKEDPIPSRQQLSKDEGAYVGIVGVGREKPPGSQWDERGMIGDSSKDPMTGGAWSALKIYQANTMQKLGVSCIANYSALYKSHSPEEQALHQVGGTEFKVCDESVSTDTECVTKDVQWTPSHRAYQTDEVEAGQGVPLDEREREFTTFNDKGEPKGHVIGLDNAQVNDILRLPNGASGSPGKPGLPTVARVLEVTQNYVRVSIQNHGKNPDAMGNTDAMGVAAERYFYKPGAQMDPIMFSELRQCDLPDGWTHSCPDVNSDSCVLDCEDSGLKKCTFKNWGSAKLYRVRDDYREGEE